MFPLLIVFAGLIKGLWVIGAIALRIWAIIDIATGKFKESNQKVVWLLVCIFLGLIGCILYLAIGRKNRMGSNSD